MMEALACHPLGMSTLEKMLRWSNLRTDGTGRHNQSPHATLEKSKSTRGMLRFLCSFGFRCANQPSMPFFSSFHMSEEDAPKVGLRQTTDHTCAPRAYILINKGYC